MQQDRRQAFKILGGMLLTTGVFSGGYYVATREGAIDEWGSVGPVGDLPMNEVTLKRVAVTEHGLVSAQSVEKVIWLRRLPDGTIQVLSGACPHNNCTSNWIPEKSAFDCRCHNSVFDSTGKVISGPAPRPMDTLEQKVENGMLLVRYQKFQKSIPEKEPLT